jgi:hypothetical protein
MDRLELEPDPLRRFDRTEVGRVRAPLGSTESKTRDRVAAGGGWGGKDPIEEEPDRVRHDVRALERVREVQRSAINRPSQSVSRSIRQSAPRTRTRVRPYENRVS